MVTTMKTIACLVFCATMMATPAFAQVDLSGNWASLQHEDWAERGPGPEVVDYLGLPLNADGRARALRYSTSSLSQPERQCVYYPPHYALFDIRLGYDHKPTKLSVFFEGRNLTNKNYSSSVVVDSAVGRYFEPGDGRAFYGGLEWRFR